MKTFLITPTNEGQELNYVETFKGSLYDAVCRANEIATGLTKVLKAGSIGVEVNDSQTGGLKFYGAIRKTANGLVMEDLTKDMR